MGAHCPPVGAPSPGFDAVRAQPPSPPKSSFYSITVKKRRIFLCGGGQHAGVCAKSPGKRPLPGHVPSSMRHPVEPEPRACPTPSTPPTPGYPARIHPSGPCVILPPTQRAPSTRSFPPGLVLVGWCGCAVAASATARRWHCVWGVCNGASLPPPDFRSHSSTEKRGIFLLRRRPARFHVRQIPGWKPATRVCTIIAALSR